MPDETSHHVGTHVRTTLAETTSEEAYIPKRFWWLKRLSLAAVVLLVAIVAIHTIANHRAKARLQSVIEGYQAAGIPIYPEDFNKSKRIPDDENAVTLYEEAAVAYTPPASVGLSYDVNEFLILRFVQEHSDEAAALISANQTALGLLHEARGRKDCDWKIIWVRPMFGMVFPYLSGYRGATKLLVVAIQQGAASKNHAAMIEFTIDGIVFADRLESMRITVGHLVSLSCTAILCRTIEDYAPSLVVAAPGAPSGAGTTPAETDGVRLLIHHLLDESAVVTGWEDAMAVERATWLDICDGLMSGNTAMLAFATWTLGATTPPGWVERVRVRVFEPLIRNDTVLVLRSFDSMTEAGTRPNYVLALENWTGTSIPTSALRDLVVTPVGLIPDLTRALQIHFRAIAHRRMAAIALAVRLYEVDQGCRPANLDALVPEYLPTVPLDPFASDGREIGYLPENDPPVLYSVNIDGVDDGGEYSAYDAKAATPFAGKVNENEKDLVFFLNGDRPDPE